MKTFILATLLSIPLLVWGIVHVIGEMCLWLSAAIEWLITKCLER